MSRDISNSADTIDSRDIIKRFEELESDLSDLQDAIDEAQGALDGAADADAGDDLDELEEELVEAEQALAEWDDKEEYEALKSLCSEGEGFSDWSHGETLINEEYFTEYAEELASEICDMKKSDSWPFNHIDWDAAAEELKQDYSTIDYDGTTFYIRS